ncbi:class I SAM-dependent methyltransferase [Paraburkholderia fungorum]|uniref:2-polyprenyl-3-methyl-5-hydroxy-6-metoxy-1, 4-benzoquinol methylase n=1 Tax=Paraburkholderia fungorum TaxID=134537 RepID=A0AAW3V412_9BURK|nr:class I SAM-dependent methyltransferase [Paraburkholderia fungorum]MBB4517442.1 2-polyprenyl-3-methyl-5-hydroxy-6-metoxy-1,4-benzoquinol methylase [Paraburkholderia fungorum]MBB6204510.1 2-polyprenyl-3-methyl-5-hydroxy-6-metoxy-1,4-benzoquinol methylase [Paraburkholderia fungorum]
MSVLNGYGDKRNPTIGNHGVDIAAQRADDLDGMALEHLRSIKDQARALDVASASGGQAIRMALAGADVLALDIDDYSEAFYSAANSAGVGGQCRFVQQDITDYDVAGNLGRFDVIVCQRMIHYVPYGVAIEVVQTLKQALKPGGRLFLSASGLHSELGTDYPAARQPIDRRYELLSDAMVEKHAMLGLVCLYSQDELAAMLRMADMDVEQVFTSAFGNVKAVAR